jgi:hypothetical protein
MTSYRRKKAEQERQHDRTLKHKQIARVSAVEHIRKHRWRVRWLQMKQPQSLTTMRREEG